MGFLDNLENNLKSLESRDERSGDLERQRRARASERASAQAAAPWAEELKKGPYTAEFLRQAARIGHEMRVKPQIAWLGPVLRLEARGRRLELRPAPDGIRAVHIEDGREIESHPVDLKVSPEDLLRRWLGAAR